MFFTGILYILKYIGSKNILILEYYFQYREII